MRRSGSRLKELTLRTSSEFSQNARWRISLSSRHANASPFLIESLVIAACLTFTPSLYEAARGFSTAAISSTASNVSSKGDRLTSSRLETSARTATRAVRITAKQSGKIISRQPTHSFGRFQHATLCHLNKRRASQSGCRRDCLTSQCLWRPFPSRDVARRTCQNYRRSAALCCNRRRF